MLKFSFSTPGATELVATEIKATNVANVASVSFKNGTKAAVGRKHFASTDGVNYTPAFLFPDTNILKPEYEVRNIDGTPWIVTKQTTTKIVL